MTPIPSSQPYAAPNGANRNFDADSYKDAAPTELNHNFDADSYKDLTPTELDSSKELTS